MTMQAPRKPLRAKAKKFEMDKYTQQWIILVVAACFALCFFMVNEAKACAEEGKAKGKKIASHYLKPGASVMLKYDERFQVKPDQEETLDIELYAPYASGSLVIEVNEVSGLEIYGPQRWRFELGAESITLPLQVKAVDEGQHYVMFSAKVESEGLVNNRVFGIAIESGSGLDPKNVAPQQAVGKAGSSKKSPKYFVMPAQEVVVSQ